MACVRLKGKMDLRDEVALEERIGIGKRMCMRDEDVRVKDE